MTLLWIIIALFAFALWRTWSHLGSEEERRAYAAELETGRFWDRYGEDTYRGWLKAGLDWLDRHVGLGLLSWRGLGVCLALTLGYNAALFAGGWALGFGTELVGLDVLPPAASINRGAFAALTGLSAAALAWGVVRIRGMGWGRGLVAGLGLAVGVGLAFLAAHRLAVGVWMPSPLSHFSIGVMVMAGAIHAAALLLALIFSGRARGPTIITLLGLGVAALASSLLGATERDRIVVLFLVGLPLFNGLFDWLSWAVTRRLTRSLVDAPLTVKRITLHLALDLVVALALAVGLTFALSLGLELAATGFSPVEIADEVAADPWGRGAWVMLMLLSTLIPTALHAGALLCAALTCRLPHAVRMSRARVLKRPIAPGDRERDWMAFFLVARWAAPLAMVALVLAGVAVTARAGAGASEIVLGETARVGAELGSNPRSLVARLEVNLLRCAQVRSSSLPTAHLADYGRAGLAAWKQARRLPINDPDLLLVASVCLSALAQHDDALDAIGRAISLAPDSAKSHHQQATTLHAMERYADALDARDRAMRLGPDSALDHQLRGITLHELGRYSDALEAKDHALRLDPDNAQYHHLRGSTLLALGRHADALEATDHAVRLDPDNARYHQQRGLTLHGLGRYTGALDAIGRAIRLDPDNARYHQLRSLTLHKMRRHEDALDAIEIAIRLDPHNARYHIDRGLTLNSMGRHDDGLAAIDHALRLDPDEAGYHHARGMALQAMGRLAESIAAYEEAVRLAPDNADYREELDWVRGRMQAPPETVGDPPDASP